VSVPEAVAVHHVPGDAHGIDTHHDRGAHLDRQLHAELVAVPQVLELRRLALGQADPGGGAIAPQEGHGIGLVKTKSATKLGDSDEGA
jgi:hypothetical protein